MIVPRRTGSRTEKSPSRAAVRARSSSLRASGVGTPPLVVTTVREAERFASAARAGALVAIQVPSDTQLRTVVIEIRGVTTIAKVGTEKSTRHPPCADLRR